MKRHLKTIIVACAVFVLFAAGPLRSEIVDRIIAIVNDQVITLSELETSIKVITKGLREDLQPRDRDTKASLVLDLLIEDALIKQSAERMGIEVSESEIDNAIEDVKKRNGLTEEALRQVLERSGLTYKQYRDKLRDDIRKAKFMSAQFRSRIKIEDEDIEEYYKSHIDEFLLPPAYRLRIILLEKGDADTLERRVKAVLEELKEGRPFDELAREFSDAPTSAVGGDIGYMKLEELSPLIRGVVERLKPGSVSPPLRTPKGVYIVQLVDVRKGKPRPLEEVRPIIHERLFQRAFEERYRTWLEYMKKVAHIEVRL